MTALTVGTLVKVGSCFVMGARVGQGSMEADKWTGHTYRVVAIRHSKITGQVSAALAAANLVEVDESDEIVDIGVTRLTVVASVPAKGELNHG